MKIKNKAFWEKTDVIGTQDKVKVASIYESFMFKSAVERLKDIRKIESVNIFGCGTGRDIKIVDEYFNPKLILASDISENMIKGCDENLEKWKLKAEIKTLIGNAADLDIPKNKFDLTTLLNSMLTYVDKREKRLEIFKNAYESLKDRGVVIGTVHNQEGKPAKTLYFKARSLFSLILKDKVGNKNTGFNGYKIAGYYYDKKWLMKDINHVGFRNIEVYSLEEFFMKIGKKYDKAKGYNQLIFIASK